MRFLIHTHLMLWLAEGHARLSNAAHALVQDTGNDCYFSAASIWEITIKRGLGRADFEADPVSLRRGPLENGWLELAVTSAHAIAVDYLPPIHKDPFDRMLLAQAQVEGMMLLTGDKRLAQYPGPVKLV